MKRLGVPDSIAGDVSAEEVRSALLNLEGVQIEEAEVLFVAVLLWAAVKRQIGAGEKKG